jgi:hypothetical protein
MGRGQGRVLGMVGYRPAARGVYVLLHVLWLVFVSNLTLDKSVC